MASSWVCWASMPVFEIHRERIMAVLRSLPPMMKNRLPRGRRKRWENRPLFAIRWLGPVNALVDPVRPDLVLLGRVVARHDGTRRLGCAQVDRDVRHLGRDEQEVARFADH